jgi:hypothetical protein
MELNKKNLNHLQRIEIRRYNMCRADGSKYVMRDISYKLFLKLINAQIYEIFKIS